MKGCLFGLSVVSASVVFAVPGVAEAATRGAETVILEFHLAKGEPIAAFEWNYAGAKLKEGKGMARVQKAVKVPVLIVGVTGDTGTVMVHTEDWKRSLGSKLYDDLLCGKAEKLYLEVMKGKAGEVHKSAFPAKYINVKKTPSLPTLVAKYCPPPKPTTGLPIPISSCSDPKPVISASCNYKPCTTPAEWKPIAGSVWSVKTYTNGAGKECKAYCTSQYCLPAGPDKAWKALYCFSCP